MLKIEDAITFAALPGAVFYGEPAVFTHADYAKRYERTVRDYAAGGDEAILWEDLLSLCFEPDEIQWHIENRGERMARGYI